MSAEQHVLGLIDARGKTRRAAMVWMELLHQSPMRSRDLLRARALRKAEGLIGFFLGEDANARLSAPRVGVTLCCLSPTGKPAVEIRL